MEMDITLKVKCPLVKPPARLVLPHKPVAASALSLVRGSPRGGVGWGLQRASQSQPSIESSIGGKTACMLLQYHCHLQNHCPQAHLCHYNGFYIIQWSTPCIESDRFISHKKVMPPLSLQWLTSLLPGFLFSNISRQLLWPPFTCGRLCYGHIKQ